MGKNKNITPEMIAEYERLTGVLIHLDKNIAKKGKNVYLTTNPDGSFGEINLTQIPNRINYYKQRALQEQVKKSSIFDIENPVKVKKQWKALSCSMTMEEIAILDKFMKIKGIPTYNKLIRLILLKFIEGIK